MVGGCNAALARSSFDAGVEAAIATFLQSPYFLYQVESRRLGHLSSGERHASSSDVWPASGAP